jgi:hypothetical protein
MADVPDDVQRWTAKRRVALVLSIVRGETSVAEAARQHRLTMLPVGTFREVFTGSTHSPVTALHRWNSFVSLVPPPGLGCCTLSSPGGKLLKAGVPITGVASAASAVVVAMWSVDQAVRRSCPRSRGRRMTAFTFRPPPLLPPTGGIHWPPAVSTCRATSSGSSTCT